MAKLPRKTQKIFCSKPTSENQTSVFGTMKTADKQYSTDVGTLQSNAAYEQGWKSATIASYKPFMEDFNTLNYINTSQLAYLFQQGIPEWDESTTYYKNSFIASGGVLYISKTDDNINNNPITDKNNWEIFSAGSSESYHPPLLSFFWSDHKVNDQSLVNALDFSWLDSDTYPEVYNELLAEYNNSASVSKTDTYDATNITFKLTPKGYKICDATQLNNLTTLYNTIGVAWYYIFDSENQRFKLPRTQFGFVGLRSSVGNYVSQSLPNIKATSSNFLGVRNTTGDSGAIQTQSVNSAEGATSNPGLWKTQVNFNASWSNSTYQDNANVQPRATEMYLYFYVGEYSQTAIEQTAGLNTELFNGKLDLDATNLNTAGKSYVAELSFPSTKAVDVNLLASGSTYTAPANGWFAICGHFGNITGALGMLNTTSFLCAQDKANDGDYSCLVSLKASKGDNIVIRYNINPLLSAAAGTPYFKFVYAKGDE